MLQQRTAKKTAVYQYLLSFSLTHIIALVFKAGQPAQSFEVFQNLSSTAASLK